MYIWALNSIILMFLCIYLRIYLCIYLYIRSTQTMSGPIYILCTHTIYIYITAHTHIHIHIHKHIYTDMGWLRLADSLK